MERPGRAKQPATGLPALPSLVRHILLLAVSLAAVATSESTEEKLDFYDKLVSSPSRLSRNIKKAGMIPYELWDDKIFSFNPFHQWLLNTTVHRYNVSRNYPLSFPCGVWVNHHYKFMFIRNRKAASTTVQDNFEKCSYKIADPELCIEELSMEHFKRMNLDPEKAWKEYFVFSTARNPWARAGSSYDYCSTKWFSQTGPCSQPPFLAYCKDPAIIGKVSNLFHCYDHVSLYHDYYHTEPVAPCLTTAEGLPAVDFLIRYEHLEEDVLEAMRIINSRRGPKLKPVPEPKFKWKKRGKAAQSVMDSGTEGSTASLLGHAEKYRQCGMECVNAIGSYFKQDVELFQIELPPKD